VRLSALQKKLPAPPILEGGLRLIFDQSPVQMLVLDPELTIVEANAALCENTLTTREEILGKGLFEAFPLNPNDPSANGDHLIRASLMRAAETRCVDIIALQQYDVQQPDGTWVQRYWSLSHVAITDDNGDVVYLVQQSQDVTDYASAMAAGVDRSFEPAELQARYEQSKVQSAARQQALLDRVSADRARLEGITQAKDEFLQIISHELRTPITTIRGNAQILAHYAARLADEDRASALHDIESESLRLSRILDNLLLLARPELGGIEKPEPCLLDRLVERAVREHRLRFHDRPIEIVAQGTSGVLVDCVETYIEQILQNLLSNAEKYSPHLAAITISIEQDHDVANVRVLDCGKGFTPDQAAHVFETYYRIADERSQKSGLGIGLAVCKRLVEVMGGTVWADSRPEGGAEVGFSLPISTARDDS
jgi:PAS domain S-box-containing protein